MRVFYILLSIDFLTICVFAAAYKSIVSWGGIFVGITVSLPVRQPSTTLIARATRII